MTQRSADTQRSEDRVALGFTEYRRAVADAVVALEVQTDYKDAFRGSLTAAETGDIHVLDVTADPHSVHRTSSLITQVPQDYVKFSLVEQGTSFVVQDGRETALHTGDMVLYDTSRPYSMLFDGPVHMSVVMFPRRFLDIPSDALTSITATRLDAGRVGVLVRPYIGALARGVGQLDGVVARRLFRTAVDMVGTLLAENIASDAIGAHELLTRRILDYIDANLDEPDLNPSSIAAAHFISVRHLHGLFSEQHTTVSTVIRTRRLERCYDELIDPRAAHRSISLIALSHGFVDPAHFSRTFRSHFGVSPSAVRGT